MGLLSSPRCIGGERYEPDAGLPGPLSVAAWPWWPLAPAGKDFPLRPADVTRVISKIQAESTKSTTGGLCNQDRGRQQGRIYRPDRRAARVG